MLQCLKLVIYLIYFEIELRIIDHLLINIHAYTYMYNKTKYLVHEYTQCLLNDVN